MGGVTVLVVQHLPIEGPYRIGQALVRAGLPLEVCKTYLGDPVPVGADGLSGLVVMGGPMAAYSDEGFPTRRAEIALLADALRRRVPTLGICLGAQLLVEAAGGRAVPGDGPEIGWASVALAGGAAEDPLLQGLPDELTPLHWHGDTVELPQGTQLLASSPAYRNQAFRYGDRAWGFQFHPEVDRAAVLGFVSEFAEECPGEVGAEIAAEAEERVAALEPVAVQVFDRFAALCA